MKYYKIPSAIILEVTGKDSPRYLQSRLTNNIKALSIGQSCLAAQLTPQGKTQGVFRVYKVEENKFLLSAERGVSEEIIPAFKKYIVADRVIVRNINESGAALWCIQVVNQPLTQANLYKIGTLGKENEFFVSETSQASEDLQSYLKKENAESISEEEFELQEFIEGKPRFGKELSEQVLFNESTIEEAVAFNKGCYVGQEVVEKIESFGKTAKIIRRFFVQNEPHTQEVIPPGTIVLNDQTELGKVLSSYYDKKSDKHIVFARVRNEQIDGLETIFIAGKKVFTNVDSN